MSDNNDDDDAAASAVADFIKARINRVDPLVKDLVLEAIGQYETTDHITHDQAVLLAEQFEYIVGTPPH
jgi:hypothetical protein